MPKNFQGKIVNKQSQKIVVHIEDFQNEKGWEGRKNWKFRRLNHLMMENSKQKCSKRVFRYQIHWMISIKLISLLNQT